MPEPADEWHEEGAAGSALTTYPVRQQPERIRTMTPEDHYNEAVRLVGEARERTPTSDLDARAAALLLAEAQVHATLATIPWPAGRVAPRPAAPLHPTQLLPAPKGYRCPACEHDIVTHREHGCDCGGCDCPAPFGRLMPGD